jgi:predicted enzyme related to lactoylglutathione lyase
MKKVTGIGGIFFRCKDVEKTKQWYNKHLGLDTDAYGCTFWQKNEDPNQEKSQQWSPFDQDTSYFGSSGQEFMVNYRVFDLKKLLSQLKKEDVVILGEIEEFEYGDFAWIKDCDGRKVELWQPKNEELFKNQ